MTSICELCGSKLVGAVAAVMHYDHTNAWPSPCERYRDRTVADLAGERRHRRSQWRSYTDPQRWGA